MINILSMSEEQFNSELVSVIKSNYPISPYGSYYMFSTTHIQQPKSESDMKLAIALIEISRAGYSYFMLNINKSNETGSASSC